MTFYDDWLQAGAEIREAFRRSPVIARDADIPWESTRQDHRVKLMISNDRGFPTMGGVVLKAEIPPGWHTGSHSHGEESIHILEGSGFSVVDGRRFDWGPGSTVQIPYRAVHQHFNTGEGPVLYLSATLERGRPASRDGAPCVAVSAIGLHGWLTVVEVGGRQSLSLARPALTGAEFQDAVRPSLGLRSC